MGLRLITPDKLKLDDRERILVYGASGIGKTRFVLSLPKGFGKIAYYAADNGSELLASIAPHKRERIVVVAPDGGTPEANFMQFCMTDWSKVDPEIKTLVVDTYSTLTYQTLQWSANTNAVDREKHFVVGDPLKGGQSIPNRGDYQAIESLSRGYLDNIFKYQKDKHIIFVCHEDVKSIDNIRSQGGPAHPGKALMDFLPGQFYTVIRLIREPVLTPGDLVPHDVVVAVTDNDGKFVAKCRTSDETKASPLGRVQLNVDPSNFWTDHYCPKFNPEVLN